MENSIQNHYGAYLKTTGELSTKIAFASFLLGSFLFASYKIDTYHTYDSILVLGFCYVVLATVFNSLVLLNLLILFFSEPGHREYFAIKMLIVLANIPVAIFYFCNMNL